jgi:hypothetical protein
MKAILKLFKPIIKKLIIRELERPDTRTYIINYINTKIDVPKLDESEENDLFNQIYNLLETTLIKIIDRV